MTPESGSATLDPNLTAEELAALAAERPDLAPLIAAHPQCYPALIEWMTTQGLLPVSPLRAQNPAPEVSAAKPDQSPTGVLAPDAAHAAARWLGQDPGRALKTAAAIGGGAVGLALVILLVGGAWASGLESRASYLWNNAPDEVIVEDAPPLAEDSGDADGSPAEPGDAGSPGEVEVPANFPRTCSELYSSAYAAQIRAAGYLATTSERTTIPAGTEDPTLAAIIGDLPRLECTWHRANGDGTGLETSVVAIDSDAAAAAQLRFSQLGYTPLAELGGIRYFTERVNGTGQAYGESHLLRDGFWFATRWVVYGPDGYTADMAGQVFG